jgi:hypothetical protein
MRCTLPANLVVINKELHYKQSNQSMALKDYFYLRNLVGYEIGASGKKFYGPILSLKYLHRSQKGVQPNREKQYRYEYHIHGN